jgi:Anaerobic ribonucleoside-triphosphate reductase
MSQTTYPAVPNDSELKAEERTRCEVWTRVMGYHRPVSAFNAGKRSEHRERLYFSESPQGRAMRIPARCAAA